MSNNKNKDKQIKANNEEELLDDVVTDVSIANANIDIAKRHGSAIKEFDVANNGIDAQAGKRKHDSLKGIKNKKDNPGKKGFGAEVAETAAENADAAVKGKKERTVRTDDIGRVNDPIYDHFKIDSKGNIISKSGSQMKFVGNNPKECLQHLSSKKYEKYIEADAKLEIPKDYYEEVINLNKKMIENLEKQLKAAKQKGNNELAEKLQKKLAKHKKINKNLRASHYTNADIMLAIKNPELFTFKEKAKLTNKAGEEGAKQGAMIGGTMAVITNTVALVKGDKTCDEAAVDTLIDTSKAAGMGYITAAAESVLKSEMQQAGKGAAIKAGKKAYEEAIAKGATKKAAEKAAKKAVDEALNNMSKTAKILQNASRTSLPAHIVSLSIESGKVMTRFLKGEIDGTECLIQMGEAGTSVIASSFGAAAYGAMFGSIGGPVGIIAGALVGAVIGQVMTTIFYKQLVDALKGAKLAREERIRIEAECAQAIEAINKYKAEMEAILDEFLADIKDTFNNAITDMRNALESDDIDAYIHGANIIIEKMGGEVQFTCKEEHDNMVRNKTALIL